MEDEICSQRVGWLMLIIRGNGEDKDEQNKRKFYEIYAGKKWL